MSESIFKRLNKEQLAAILDALPLEFIFVDDEDRLQYYNKAEKRSGQGRDNLLGRDIRECHQPSSLPRTNQMLDSFRNGTSDEDEFWIGGDESRLLNRFLAVRDKSGKYMGCLEYLLDFAAVEQLEKDKAGAYHFNPAPAETESVKDEH